MPVKASPREKPPARSERARLLAERIRAAARRHRGKEENFKIEVERALYEILPEIGVEPDPDYERISKVGGGRPDAIYGHVSIEYEAPGKLSKSTGLRETIGQLQRHLTGLAGGKREALRRVLGVSLDGDLILFLRWTERDIRWTDRIGGIAVPLPTADEQLKLIPEKKIGGTFQVLGPYPVDEASIHTFLLYLRSLKKRALTPEALAETLGPGSVVAKHLIPALYDAAVSAPHPRVHDAFQEWDNLFGVVYGKAAEKATKAAAILAEKYEIKKTPDLKPFLFSIHTYYVLLMKLLAVELLSLQRRAKARPVTGFESLDEKRLLAFLRDLEEGRPYAALGVTNFLEADFFGWYEAAWNDEIADGVRRLGRALADFDPATPTIDPEPTRDLLKRLYQYLLTPEIRRDLGEFYTPDWLADRVIQGVSYDGNPAERLLDPACGSGTFLVRAIQRVRRHADKRRIPPEEAARAIVRNIVGFDLNPLAVIAARTNYLLAMGPLFGALVEAEKREVPIPVYCADSILSPVSHGLDRSLRWQSRTAGQFALPLSMGDADRMEALAKTVEESLPAGLDGETFFVRLGKRLGAAAKELGPGDDRFLIGLYEKVRDLDKQGRNRIWVRRFKNALAPHFAGRFKYVIGNPPWIRWGLLAEEYRKQTLGYWQDYGLFSLKGMEARLGSGEKDFSMLFVYVCLDRYVEEKGQLAFVITQEVFKSKGAGEGFRRFRLGADPGSPPFAPEIVDDMVDLQPFEGASNKTAVAVFKKGMPVKYPVTYYLWTRRKDMPKKIGRIPTDWTLEEVVAHTTREEQKASPVGGPCDPWQTAAKGRAKALGALSGAAAYQARIGARVEPYGVVWLKINSVRRDGRLVVENLPELGKRTDIKKETGIVIEPDLVYPAVRGGDIRRWHAEPEVFVLVTQDPATREGIAEDVMKEKYLDTLKYLLKFKKQLLNRGSRSVRELAERTVFYSQFGIGPYTFAPFRVVWKRMANDLVACVLAEADTPYGRKLAIPTDTTSLIAEVPKLRRDPRASTFINEDEAHFLCALLNSTPARDYVKSFSSGGRGFGAPAILKFLRLPDFDPKDETHRTLSKVGREAAKLAAAGKPTAEIEAEVDALAAKAWKIATT